jgi:hypothetical protein
MDTANGRRRLPALGWIALGIAATLVLAVLLVALFLW